MEDILKEKALRGELFSEEEFVKLGFTCKVALLRSYTKNGVEFNFYDREKLLSIEINGAYIEDLFEISEYYGTDGELQFKASTEALLFAYKKAGII